MAHRDQADPSATDAATTNAATLDTSALKAESERITMRVGSRTRALGGWLVDRVLPPRCPLCRQGISIPDRLCPACWREVEFINPPLCDRLGIPLATDPGPGGISLAAATSPPPYHRARAVAAHTGAMRRLIHLYKYSDREDLTRLLGHLLCGPVLQPLIEDCEMIVPLPLAWRRLVWRRFNQSAHLARSVGAHAGRPVALHALRRRRATLPQVGLTRHQRADNVASAFVVGQRHKWAIEGRRVLLVDDVITTGATIAAATKALREGGAASVDVIALAMVTDARTPSG